MENILWKIAYPAEFHAQTAIECAIQLHPLIKERFDDIEAIHVRTQEPAMRIISKKGPLKNPADRDHCLEYMIAVALGLGRLEADDYEDEAANNPIIEHLRSLIQVKEDSAFTKDYYDLNKRAIPNALQIEFKNGQTSDWVVQYYPLGHPERRAEGLPLLREKFENNLKSFYKPEKVIEILRAFSMPSDWKSMSLDAFFELLKP
jgi:2-methylcitrate dehydratase